MACLSFKVVVGNFNISQFQLKSSICFSKSGDFFLKNVLSRIGFGLGLFIFRLYGPTRQYWIETMAGAKQQVKLRNSDLPFLNLIIQTLHPLL